MDPSDFRAALGEFADETKYPDAIVQFWLNLSVNFVNAERWGPLTDYGVQLATAHALVLGVKNSAGGVPGNVNGPVASKSVDKVSVSYNSAVIALDGAGAWNMSSYGIQFFTYAQMMGMGGLQL